jgi:hypothetical protein
MIVSVSDRGDPAKINFKMLSTDSLEMRPDSFRARSTAGSNASGDSPAVSMEGPFPSSIPGAFKSGSSATGDDKHLASARNRIQVRAERGGNSKV